MTSPGESEAKVTQYAESVVEHMTSVAAKCGNDHEALLMECASMVYAAGYLAAAIGMPKDSILKHALMTASEGIDSGIEFREDHAGTRQ